MRSCLVLALICLGATLSAAPFQNLGFDDANTNNVSINPGPAVSGIGPADELLPFWQLFKGETLQSTLGLNLDLLSFGYATLISRDQGAQFGFDVEGSYALALFGSPGNQDPFSLLQRGELPSDARTLSFKYSGFPFNVSINDTDLRIIAQGEDSAVFDISQFAGQIIDLRLTALGSPMPNEAGVSYIDSITIAIPEPSVVLLIGVGVFALVLRKRLMSIR